MKSYAQFGEDLILLDFFNKKKLNKGFFFEFGGGGEWNLNLLPQDDTLNFSTKWAKKIRNQALGWLDPKNPTKTCWNSGRSSSVTACWNGTQPCGDSWSCATAWATWWKFRVPRISTVISESIFCMTKKPKFRGVCFSPYLGGKQFFHFPPRGPDNGGE